MAVLSIGSTFSAPRPHEGCGTASQPRSPRHLTRPPCAQLLPGDHAGHSSRPPATTCCTSEQ